MRRVLALAVAGALLGAPALAADAPVQVPDTLAQRLQPCMACHGAQGRASRDGYLPRIAGKPAGYLYQQLLHFRDGRRQNATMARLLAQQTDAYLGEMAGHFAALDLPHAPPAPSPAPAALLAARCRFIDLDGPALQAEDWPGGFRYRGGTVHAAAAGFWG